MRAKGCRAKNGTIVRGVAAEWLQGQSVLEFSQIERGGASKLDRRAVHFREKFPQVEEYLHAGREPDARRSGQVAVMHRRGRSRRVRSASSSGRHCPPPR